MIFYLEINNHYLVLIINMTTLYILKRRFFKGIFNSYKDVIE